jgi:NADH:ubiquinone reductase (H+-translocating)
MASSPGPGADRAVHRIVIVGGGAGRLALATRLGHTLGRKGLTHITLIERTRSHLRKKPPLREIAAGRIGQHGHATGDLAQDHQHGLRCRVGESAGLDHEQHLMHTAPPCWWQTGLGAASRLLTRGTEPCVKLH